MKNQHIRSALPGAMRTLLSISLLFPIFGPTCGNAGIQPGDLVYADAKDSTIMRFDPISTVSEKLADFDVFGSGPGWEPIRG